MNDQIQSLIRAYADGVITQQQLDQLQQALREDAAVREQFLHEMNVHAALDDLATGTDDAISSREGLEIADVGASDSPEKQLDSTRRWLWLTPARFAMAATVLIAVGSLSFFAGRGHRGAETAAVPRTVEGVARLVSTVDAQWKTMEPFSGTSLDVGEYQLVAGTVELELGEGARVSLRGPATFELKNAGHLHLLGGKLVARIPEEALGFTVTTPQSEVVDLGTVFGLAVDDTSQTDIHVLDGLVEVHGRTTQAGIPTTAAMQAGIKISEGQARRLAKDVNGDLQISSIQCASRNEILGNERSGALGLSLLRGNVRLRAAVSGAEMAITAPGQSWIEVIPEKVGVALEEDTAVTFRSPGNYRFFGDRERVVPSGTRVDSFLLHFRSTEGELVQGVIKFDRPIVGLICEGGQLAQSDSAVGLEGATYPVHHVDFRGLEPHNDDQTRPSPSPTKEGGWSPDEVTLSHDMTTLGVSVSVEPIRGIDQLRVLIRSKE